MRRRAAAILLVLCMVLTLLPVAAFATEDGGAAATVEQPAQQEEKQEEQREGQQEQQEPQPEETPEQPEEQPEAKPEPQQEAEGENTPVLLNEGSTTTVTTEAELTAALAGTAETIQLAANIDISSALTVTRTVTLDLNGKVLRMTRNDTVIDVKKGNPFGIGYLTLTDSDSAAVHKFTPNEDGLWVLDETNGTKTVNGGVITGGKYMGIFVEGYGTQNPTQKPDEAACAHLIMKGGNIVGCMTERNGGGVCAVRHAYFTMTGGSIRGCVAKNSGGGVSLSGASVFDMSGSALIADCVSTGSANSAGGGIDAYGSSVTLSGNAAIQNCTAELGGGVNLDTTDLTMSGNASITGCTATNGGGGVHTQGNIKGNTVVFTMKDASSIVNCTALKGGGVFFMTNSGVMSLAGNAKIENCRAIEREGLSTPDVFGGGVHVVIGRLEISGGSITGCTAAKGGDSVYTEPNGGFTMTGGSVDGSVRLSYKVDYNTVVYMDGLGTEAYPYEIGTADQLKLFRDIVNGANGQTQNPAACAKLMNDIVLNDGTFDENGNYTPGSSGKAAEKWTPIAYSGLFTENTTLYYTGTFDGQGHTIRGLYVSEGNGSYIEDQVCLGLFSTAKNAVIRNVTVTGYVFGFAGNLGGIVGYLTSGGTIENCANHCTVKSTLAVTEGPSYIGGIAGGMDFDSTIRDCYNTGTITVDTYLQWNSAGGIVGYNGGSTVSNCYNVGKIAGNGWYNGEIVGRNSSADGYETPSVVNNSYYLNDTDTDPQARTAAEFGSGTVLALLINGRDDSEHPWNSECKYLAAAGRTLPVFKTQTGDAHTHKQSSGWEADETYHWQVCACGAVFHKAEHSGGEATCTAKAECTGCGRAYGEKNPTNHTGTPGQWQHDADRHWKIYSCCNAETEAGAHHGGEATCIAKAECEDCGVVYGGLDSNNHTDLKHFPAQKATILREGNIEHWYCSDCGKYFKDADATLEITQEDTVIPKVKRDNSGIPSIGGETGKTDKTDKNDKTVKSVNTGDVGVALYGAMALLSLTGGAWIIGKKRR